MEPISLYDILDFDTLKPIWITRSPDNIQKGLLVRHPGLTFPSHRLPKNWQYNQITKEKDDTKTYGILSTCNISTEDVITETTDKTIGKNPIEQFKKDCYLHFQKQCYERYKLYWCMQQNITMDDIRNTPSCVIRNNQSLNCTAEGTDVYKPYESFEEFRNNHWTNEYLITTLLFDDPVDTAFYQNWKGTY